jgi:peptide/nickel transport system substrate-binding protein
LASKTNHFFTELKISRRQMKRTFLTTVLLVCVATTFYFCKTGEISAALTGNKTYVRLSGEPERLNPLTTEDVNAMQVMSYIYPRLLDFDPQTLELTPVLAKSRPIVATIDTGKLKGGTSYTYEIRDEAMWDNGKPVTAADVVFSLKAILNPKSGASNWRSGLDFIKNIVIDATNPKKYTILSNKKYFLGEMQTGTMPILPEYVYDTEGSLKAFSIADIMATDTAKIAPALLQFANNIQSAKFSREKGGIVGCGAYAFDEWKTGERIVLKKKTNWWGDKLADQSPLFMALPDELHFRPVKDEAAAMSLLKDGQFDAMVKLAPKDYLEMSKNDTFKNIYNFATAPSYSLAHIGINCKSPKLNDKRTRRALAHLVDVPTIIAKLMRGLAEPCVGPFIPQRPYYSKDLKAIDLNIDQSKTLLAAAGWKNTNGDSTLDKSIGGKTTELTLRVAFAANNGVAKNIGLMMQENAAKVGVKVELLPIEGAAFLAALKKRDFDLYIHNAGFEAYLDSPKEMWATSSNTPDGGNRFQFENKTADALIAQIESELDATKRDDLYKKFQALLYDEQPAIFLFTAKERLALNKRFDATVMANPRRLFWLGQFKLKG